MADKSKRKGWIKKGEKADAPGKKSTLAPPFEKAGPKRKLSYSNTKKD